MMPDREKVIKGLHDARRYLEDKEWSDRGASPHIDSINDALALLKEQEADIKNLNETIMNLLQKITEMKMIYGDCEYVGELVRCKDCKHCYFASNRIPCEQTLTCEKHGMDITPDWFCADGEREGR